MADAVWTPSSCVTPVWHTVPSHPYPPTCTHATLGAMQCLLSSAAPLNPYPSAQAADAPLVMYVAIVPSRRGTTHTALGLDRTYHCLQRGKGMCAWVSYKHACTLCCPAQRTLAMQRPQRALPGQRARQHPGCSIIGRRTAHACGCTGSAPWCTLPAKIPSSSTTSLHPHTTTTCTPPLPSHHAHAPPITPSAPRQQCAQHHRKRHILCHHQQKHKEVGRARAWGHVGEDLPASERPDGRVRGWARDWATAAHSGEAGGRCSRCGCSTHRAAGPLLLLGAKRRCCWQAERTLDRVAAPKASPVLATNVSADSWRAWKKRRHSTSTFRWGGGRRGWGRHRAAQSGAAAHWQGNTCGSGVGPAPGPSARRGSCMHGLAAHHCTQRRAAARRASTHGAHQRSPPHPIAPHRRAVVFHYKLLVQVLPCSASNCYPARRPSRGSRARCPCFPAAKRLCEGGLLGVRAGTRRLQAQAHQRAAPSLGPRSF